MERDRLTKYFWTIMRQSVFRILFMRHPTLLKGSLKVTIKHISQTQFNKWHCTLLHVSIPKKSSSGNSLRNFMKNSLTEE